MRKTNIKFLNSNLPDSFDYFICSSSFEYRCLSAPRKLVKKSFKKVIIIENKAASKKNEDNAQAIFNMYKGNSCICKIDYNDPLCIADFFYTNVKRSSSGHKSKILIDITSFTHETLMILLKILSIKKSQVEATLIYTNALDYSPSNEVGHKWLSQGCKEVHSILGYPGVLFPSQKNRLIVVVGYEYNRVADIVYALEPHNLTLVYGSPKHSTTERNKEANKYYSDFLQQMKFDFDQIDSEMIPCDNPDQTATILSSLYLRYANENIMILPMNNKLSTIGVAKSIIQNEIVQACYAPAIVYNEEDYSLPGSICYIYDGFNETEL